MRSYLLQRIQSLEPADYSFRTNFASWFPQNSVTDIAFATFMLFIDEASLPRKATFNSHIAHLWALDNSHGKLTRKAQRRFFVSVPADIVGDHLVGPYLLPPRLDSTAYLIFL